MKMIKTKLGRAINFIKNEGKFKRSDYVKVMQNTSKRKEYDKYVGQRAIVTDVHYDKKEYVVGLKFLDGKNFDFKICEIEKCNWKEMFDSDYSKLLKMI